MRQGWPSGLKSARLGRGHDRGGRSRCGLPGRLRRLRASGAPDRWFAVLYVLNAATVAARGYGGSIRAFCEDVEAQTHVVETAQEIILRRAFEGLPADTRRSWIAILSLSDVALSRMKPSSCFRAHATSMSRRVPHACERSRRRARSSCSATLPSKYTTPSACLASRIWSSGVPRSIARRRPPFVR